MNPAIKCIIGIIMLIIVLLIIIYYICSDIINNSFSNKLCKALSIAKFDGYYCYEMTWPEATNYKFYAYVNDKIYKVVYWVNKNEIDIQQINTVNYIPINPHYKNKAIKILNKRILLNNLSENDK